jgi:dihydrofolate reductase
VGAGDGVGDGEGDGAGEGDGVRSGSAAGEGRDFLLHATTTRHTSTSISLFMRAPWLRSSSFMQRAAATPRTRARRLPCALECLATMDRHGQTDAQPMASLIYAMNTSLDGYIYDREGDFTWAIPGRAFYEAINELERRVGTYLYGRRLYETMTVWDTAHLEPGAPAFSPGNGELEREFADLWRAADKIVFSTKLAQASTPRTRIERTFEPERIRELKATSDRDLTVGGANLAAQMIAADLVDEYHAFVHPFIVGGGMPFLPQNVRVPLELVREQRLDRIVHLQYRRS